MTTALLVVNASSFPGYDSLPKLVYWVLPAMIGAPFIARTVKKFAQ